MKPGYNEIFQSSAPILSPTISTGLDLKRGRVHVNLKMAICVPVRVAWIQRPNRDNERIVDRSQRGAKVDEYNG